MPLHKPATPGDDEREAAKLGYAEVNYEFGGFFCIIFVSSLMIDGLLVTY
jgi:hypothetical protein